MRRGGGVGVRNERVRVCVCVCVCVCARARVRVAQFFSFSSVSAAYERTYLPSHLLKSHGLRERRGDWLLDASGFNGCSDICPQSSRALLYINRGSSIRHALFILYT